MYLASRSPLFLVKVVEVEDLPDNRVLDAETVEKLAAVRLGTANLFDLELRPIEARLLSHPWIKEVKLQKRFPQTVSISVILRTPRALLQKKDGSLFYVDQDGQLFSRVNASIPEDAPVLVDMEDQTRRKEALRLMEQWEKSIKAELAQISSISYDDERGFRLFVTYALSATTVGRGRTTIELGTTIDPDLEDQLLRLHKVLTYLSENGVAARQILTDAGKKIVVKIARRS
jgi:cell division septal protein FtsQ